MSECEGASQELVKAQQAGLVRPSQGEGVGPWSAGSNIGLPETGSCEQPDRTSSCQQEGKIFEESDEKVTMQSLRL